MDAGEAGARRAARANQTFEPIAPPWQAIREGIPDDEMPAQSDWFDQRSEKGKPVEIPLEDGSILVLDGD